MEDVNFSKGAVFGSSFATDMDFDFMDELFQGCWFQACEGSELWQQSPSIYRHPQNPQFPCPSQTYQTESPQFPMQKNNQENLCKASFQDKKSDLLEENGAINLQPTEPEVSNILEDFIHVSEAYRKWWIGSAASSPSLSLMERLMGAIACIKESKGVGDVLIQIWVPINTGGNCVLTTEHQPYVLDLKSTSLANYRNVSVTYKFSAEHDSKGTKGTPTRVFLGKVPEWTPDVRLYKSEECARIDYAQRFDVRGTLILPIFDQGSRTCLGVIEVVTTKQKIKYQQELESVCSALQAFDLSSVKVQSPPTQTCNQSYQTVLPEICKVLK